MIEMVAQLRSFLTARGILAFTFFDPQWNAFNGDPFPGSNLNWRLHVNKATHPVIDVESLLDKSRGAHWVTLVDHELFVNGDGEYESANCSPDQKAYIVFCDPEHMRAIFPESEILPPAAPERHHCCIIRGSSPPSGKAPEYLADARRVD
jgi:hypothetical protein